MSTISASEARRTLPEQLDRVEAGGQVAISRHGRVVAVLVRPDVLATRRAVVALQHADSIGDLLAQARQEPVIAVPITTERLDELSKHVEASRSDR